MRRSLEGQVAIVTGASRGLGRAIVDAFVEQGMRIALFARPSDALDETANRFGDSVLACPCDIRAPAETQAAVNRAAAQFGQINVLINNAAACLPNKIERAPDTDIRTEIETNLMGTIWCSRAVIPHMRDAGRGDIINISSEAAASPAPFMTSYGATKAAIEVFSAGLRAEVKEYGIRIAVLRSGAMATSITDQWSEPQKQAFFAAYAQTHRGDEVGRDIDPATTADAIVNVLRLPDEASIRLIELGCR